MSEQRTEGCVASDGAAMEAPKRRRGRMSAVEALVTAALDEALTPIARKQLRGAKRLAVVIGVPSKGWVQAVKQHLFGLSSLPTVDFSRDGSMRSRDVRTEGNDEVSSALASGKRVIGVSQAPDRMLPESLLNSADLRISVRAPRVSTITKAMKLCLRGRRPKLPISEADVAGLDFSDFVSAMRKGSSPQEAASRLRATVDARWPAARRLRLPSLEEATFYGEAREWGLRLKSDVDAWRAGEIADLSGADKGVCLYGPPGSGKSYFAMILADSLKLPLVSTSVAELFATSTGYLDSVIRAQRKVFETALARAPSIMFIDELEAMPNRAMLSPRGRDFWLPLVDDFLLLLDSATSSRDGVVVIGATNRIEDIEVALLRPNRLERAIEVRAPDDAADLAQIIRFHLRDDLLDSDLLSIAETGIGATAAEAMMWVRGARRRAREARRPMIVEDLAAEVAPPDTRSPHDLRIGAVHEAAHAVVAMALGLGPPARISLIMRPGAGGSMQLGGTREPGLMTRATIENLAVVALAGRASEAVILSHVTGGAGGAHDSDLSVATRLVACIHATYGLGDSLVFRSTLGGLDDLIRSDRDVLALVDRELKRLLHAAEGLVTEYRDEIEAVAEELLMRRHLTGAQLSTVLDRMSSPIVAGGDRATR